MSAPRSDRRARVAALALAAAALAIPSARAQDPPAPTAPPRAPAATAPPERGREVREEMRRYFRARLRVELGLTDAQAAAIAPRLDEIEASRAEMRRERARLHGELDRRIRAGDGDARIDETLKQLDDLQARHETRVRGLMREINAELSPRQRADLRLFLERFRREMRDRVNAYRDDRPPRRS